MTETEENMEEAASEETEEIESLSLNSEEESVTEEEIEHLSNTDVKAEGTCGNNLTWVLGNNGVLTISGKGEMKDYDFRNTPWYEYRESMTTLVIEPGVTGIGDYAFFECSGFTGNLSIPDSVKSIGVRAFCECSGFKGNLKIPSSVKSIGRDAFKNCSGFDGYLIIEDGVKSIGYYSFYNCSGFTGNLSIPDSVKSIGDGAFCYCSGFTGNLSIPDGLKSIGGYAFSNCSGFTGNLRIPSSVTSIGNDAFYDCSGFTGNLRIPSSVTSIGDDAFHNCSGFKGNLIIPSSVTSMGFCAFYRCTGFSNIIFQGDAPSLHFHEFSNQTVFEWVQANVYYPSWKSGWDNTKGYGYNLNWISYQKGSTPWKMDDNTTTPQIPKDATADDVLELVYLDDLFTDISFEWATIKGPTVTVAGKTFNLFSFDTSIEWDLCEKVQAKVDLEKETLQILIGFEEFKGSADLSKDANKNAYWSESYQQVKSLYTGLTGKNVDSTELWNQFSKLRGRLKKMNCTLGISASASVAGYMEFDFASGDFVYSEGGVILEADLGASMEYKLPPCPAIYATFGVSADFDGSIKLVREEAWCYTPTVSAAVDLAVKFGVGAGEKKIKTYAELGMSGAIKLAMELPAISLEKALTATLSASVYFESKILGFSGPSYGPKTFASYQLYPNTEEEISLLGGEDLTDFDLSTATLSERTYLQETEAVAIDLEQDNILYSKKNLYSYCVPQLVTLNDGTLFLAWIDDDGSKTGINKTSLMYTVYTGSAWSSAEKIAEIGGANDYPCVYSDGERVHIVWQKAKELSDSDTLVDLLESIDLYYVTYENGEISEETRITQDNRMYEMMNVVSSNGSKTAIAWVENTVNQPFQTEGTNCIKVKEYIEGTWTEKIIESDLSEVANLTLVYVDDELFVVYEIENQIIVRKGDVEKKLSGYGATITKGILYYNSENGIVSYDLQTESVNKINIVSLGDFSVVDNGVEKILLSTVYNGYNSDLIAYTYDYTTGMWSDAIQLTQEEKYIRSYSSALNADGNLIVACNFVETTQNDNTVFGAATLSVVSFSEETDLILDSLSVYFYDSNVKEGASLPIYFSIKNNGINHIESFHVTLSDASGRVLQEGDVTCDIRSGETVETSFLYQLPTPFEYQTLTLKISGENEEKLDDNIAEIEIGNADISVENMCLSGMSSEAKMEINIKNIGYVDAENISVWLYENSMQGDMIGKTTVAKIDSQESTVVEIPISEEYVSVNPLASDRAFYVRIETTSTEQRFDNNTAKFLLTSLLEKPIKLNYDTLQMKVGDEKTLTVTYVEENTQTVSWTSSDDSIVSVTDGLVRANAAGVATITATVGEEIATCTVTVEDTEISVTDIYLEETSVNLLLEETKQLSAHVLPVNATNQKIIWESSDTSIVTVDENGLLKGIAVGNASISVISEDGYKTAYVNVTVSRKEEEKTYTLSFSGGDGAVGNAPTSIISKAGEHVQLPENPYSKTGMKFVGWSDGTNVYKEGINYIVPHYDVVMTAQWETILTDDSEDNTAGGGSTGGLDDNTAGGGSTGDSENNFNDDVYDDYINDDIVDDTPNIDIGEVDSSDIPETGEIIQDVWTSSIADVTYTGSAQKPAVRVYDGTKLLQEGSDYTVSYKNNTKVNISGNGSDAPQAVVNMKGAYSGSYTIYFKIQPIDISSGVCASNDLVAKYTGKNQTPTPTLLWNGKKLTYGTDYSVEEYGKESFKEAGTHTLTLKGKNNFTGERKITLTISDDKNQIDMSKVSIKGISTQSYTGKQITPSATSVSYKKATLVANKEYIVTYGANVEVGTGTVTFTGTGVDADKDGLSYIGSKTVTFKITGGSINKAKVTGIDKQYSYDGSLIKPTATLTHNSTTLTEGKDYTVSYNKNRNKGTATIIFTGINGYTGTKKQTFKIVAGKMTEATIGFQDSGNVKGDVYVASYTGSAVKPEIVVKYGNTTLVLGKDYTVSYKNNKKAADSTAKKAPSIVIKGKGNYKGSKTVTFTIQ